MRVKTSSIFIMIALLCLYLLIPDISTATGIKIISPANNAIYHPGDQVEVTVQSMIETTIQTLLIASKQGVVEITSPPFTAGIDLPQDIAGSFDIMALAKTTTEEIRYAFVTVLVTPLEELMTLDVSPKQLKISPGDIVLLSVYGVYSDDAKLRLQDLKAGTTYNSDNSSIATVDEKGLVTAKSYGDCNISVRNGTTKENVSVQVIRKATNVVLPVACAGGPYMGIPGIAVSFDASCSFVTDGNIIKYEWDWDSDGTYDTPTTSPYVTHLWITPYRGTVALRVTGDNQASAHDSALIEIRHAVSLCSQDAYLLIDDHQNTVSVNVGYRNSSAVPIGSFEFSYWKSNATFNVNSTEITSIKLEGDKTARLKGKCTVNDSGGYSFIAIIIDSGSPGAQNDVLGVDIINPDGTVFETLPLSILEGGNLQVTECDPIVSTCGCSNKVIIDIKPGSDSNSINLKSKGVIPLGILTTDIFDATTVDPMSVEFGPDKSIEAHGKGHIEDVDGDGDLDLVLHFRTQNTGIACGDTSAFLTGQTFDGQLIKGSDSINTVKCK